MNNYNVKTTTRTAAPRSKMLKELGVHPGTTSGVPVIPSGGGGQSTDTGDGHTHANLDALNAIRVDELFYLWLYMKQNGADESTLEKVKAGFADKATEAEKAFDSEKWGGKVFAEWMNQPVRKEDWVEFLGVMSKTFKTPNFAPGMTGKGAIINNDGSMEAERLTVRRELIVPKLVYNMVEIQVGDKWRAPGAGVIEKVVPDTDAEGNILNTGTFYLELKKGQIGAVYNGAICMGIFHDYGDDTNNATDDYDDGYGNRKFAGFTTSYFTITEISNYVDEDGVVKKNGQVRYQLRPVSDRWTSQSHPYEQMNFVCYGIFSDNAEKLKKYGTAVYETRTYTRMLVNQNTWEFAEDNIALQYGEMGNLSKFGVANPEDYALYVGRIYTKGTITQVKDDGTKVQVANERGVWVTGTTAAYYDRFSHKGGLWLCIAEEGTTSEPSSSDPSWLLQVEAGASIQGYNGWKSKNCPYPISAIVPFAGSIFITLAKTSEPPYPLLTDSEGNYITQSDGSYIIIDKVLNADWSLLMDAASLAKGDDGTSVECQFSTDKVEWHYPAAEGDVYVRIRQGNDTWGDPIRVQGEAGNAGKDAPYTVFEFAVGSSLTVAPTSGWTDAPQTVQSGQYLWFRCGVVVPPSTTPDSWNAYRVGGEKGEKGDGYSHCGEWKSAKMPAKPMNVYTMGGKMWVAKVATLNPPLFTLTDSAGNRLVDKDGYYLLNGETNIDEYDLLLENGKDGQDGHDGNDGKPGVSINGVSKRYLLSSKSAGITIAGNNWSIEVLKTTAALPYLWGYEIITFSDGSTTTTNPHVIGNFAKDGKGIKSMVDTYGISASQDVEPTSWFSYMPKLSETNRYLWCKTVTTYTDESTQVLVRVIAVQGLRGPQGLPGSNGLPGPAGCVMTYAEWAENYEWRNDEALTSGTRILSTALIQDSDMASGWRAFKCKETHISTQDTHPLATGGTTYWEEYSLNVMAIFTNIILGKQAHIDLLQGNDIFVKGPNGVVTAGLSGSQSGNKIRLWIGATAEDRESAPYRVNESGEFWATMAHIIGEIHANSGTIGGFEIADGRIGVDDGTAGANKGLFLTNEMIGFNGTNRQVILGLLANLGTPFLLRLLDSVVSYTDRYGVSIGVTGSRYNNTAVHLSGGHMSGAAFRTRAVSTTTTLGREEYSVVCLNTSEISITLPTMRHYDDGHIVKIKTLNSGKVKVKPGVNYNADGTQRTSYISCNRGVVATATDPATQDNQGEAAEYVYHHNVSSGDYQGCWVQYKHPRDW